MKQAQIGRALLALFLMAWLLALAPRPASATTCPCSMWGNTVPGTVDSGPDSYVKLGMEFGTDVDGYATGIRFYKSAANTGTHVGELWAFNNSGRFPLASVTFTNETASGWQYAALTVPIQLHPNESYVVSYTAPNGHYSYDAGYFASPRSNDPLRVLNTGGRFTYYSSPDEYPNITSTANYWVDVDFQTTPPGQTLFERTNTPPVNPNGLSDGLTFEVGTTFSSDVNARVIGIRYWNEHKWFQFPTVRLWKDDGTLLASAQQPNALERFDWFELYFNSSVEIQAGTSYVTSYTAAPETYAHTANFFNAPYANGFFHSPVNAGVYTLGSSGAFPTTHTSTNYWVEPIFDTQVTSRATSSVGVDVDPSLSFTTSARATACNGATPSSDSSSGASSVGLGRISASTTAIGVQDLQVTTNAAHGYTVYARGDGPLNDGAGHTIADLNNGASNASPGAFESPGSNAFGYTTSDSALSATGDGPDRFTNSGPKWAPMGTTDSEISYSATGAIDKTVCLAFQVTVAGSTPAGRYATHLTYTAVPIF